MNPHELETLVAVGEGDTVEWKETTGQRTEGAKTLCAFLNKDGGTVVFGVTRKGRLTGQLVSDSTKRDLAEEFKKFEPAAEIQTDWVSVDDTHVAVVCRVCRGPARPYVWDGRPYKRVQSTTTTMPQEEYERMLKARSGFASMWERKSDPDVSLDDLDLDEVARTARIAVAEGRLPPEVDSVGTLDLLHRLGLTDGDQPSNGAVALFGKNFARYPQCAIKLAWFKGTDKRVFLDNRLVEGNLFRLQNEAMAFCFKHLNLSSVIRGLYREEELEIPAEALREAIVNSLAHRLYESTGTVSLAIYDDRVEISNPGGFNPAAGVSEAFPGMDSTPRNPTIARVLYLRKAIETWGRGIGLMVRACEAARIAKPKICEERGFVRAVFARPSVRDWNDKIGAKAARSFARPESGSHLVRRDPDSDPDAIQIDPVFAEPFAARVLETIRGNPLVSRKQLAVELGVSERKVRNALKRLGENGIVVRQGADHGGIWRVARLVSGRVSPAPVVAPVTPLVVPNSRTPNSRTPNSRTPNSRTPNSRPPNSRNHAEIGLTRLLAALTDAERGSSDLTARLDLKNRTDLYVRFLLPSLQQGLIEYTIPDKPNSRLQKYRLTAKGRALLGRNEGGEGEG